MWPVWGPEEEKGELLEILPVYHQYRQGHESGVGGVWEMNRGRGIGVVKWAPVRHGFRGGISNV